MSVDGEWRWFWNGMRPFAGYQLGALSLMLLGVAVNAINPLLLKALIDDVLPHQRTMLLGAITAAFLATYIGSNVLSSAGRSINQLGILRFVYQLRIRLTTHLLALSPSFHESRPVGDLLRRVEEDVALVGELGSDVLPSILRVLVQGVVTVAAMATLDWRLACVVLPVLPASVYVRQRFRGPLRTCAQAVRDASGRQTSLLNELVTSAVQIQALGAQRRQTHPNPPPKKR
jgi:ABC-type bacteriocin/lantibiotic exporter with double-glycine peptidase domain